MDELLTRAERERIARLRRDKWKKITDAMPLLEAFMRELNEPYRFNIKDSKGKVVRSIRFNGGDCRIISCTIGKEKIIG